MNLHLDNAAFSIDGVNILSPVNLALRSAACCVLLGPNGAGKSTLMRIASGYAPPTSGAVNLDGESMHALTLKQKASKLGVLTQRSDLDFPFTAGEVVAMGRTPYGGGENDPVVAEVIARLGIQGHRIYTSLSGGEKQLVQLARVFAQVWHRGEEAFLLLDEPMTALDLNHQQVLVSVLREFSESGTGQLIVMHDINLAADIADRIVLMRHGCVIKSGAPAEVLNAESLAETFGTPMTVMRDGDEFFYKARLE